MPDSKRHRANKILVPQTQMLCRDNHFGRSDDRLLQPMKQWRSLYKNH
ncbi:MAG: hypothetical protein V7L20_26090 [Nostoc sp.]